MASACGEQEKTKLMMSSSLHSTENLSLLSTTSTSRVLSSLSSSSLSPGTTKSFSSTHLPFLATSTEKQSLLLSQHNTTSTHLNTANLSNHISPLTPGNHVQVIDLKNWPKSLADPHSAATVVTSPSAIHFPLPTSHPLIAPTLSNLSTCGNATINAGMSNPVTVGSSVQALKGMV